MSKVNFENHPNFIQAKKAQEEADIIHKQSAGVFLSEPVQLVMDELKSYLKKMDFSYYDESVIMMLDLFNYGYILGKREERKRHKK